MSCAKTEYAGYRPARSALRRIRRRAYKSSGGTYDGPIRVYRCPDCGYWHLTSSKEKGL